MKTQYERRRSWPANRGRKAPSRFAGQERRVPAQFPIEHGLGLRAPVLLPVAVAGRARRSGGRTGSTRRDPGRRLPMDPARLDDLRVAVDSVGRQVLTPAIQHERLEFGPAKIRGGHESLSSAPVDEPTGAIRIPLRVLSLRLRASQCARKSCRRSSSVTAFFARGRPMGRTMLPPPLFREDGG